MLKSQFTLLGVWDVVITANDLHVCLKQSHVIWVQQRVELHNQLRQFPSWEQRVVCKRPESHMGQDPQSHMMRTCFHVTVRRSLLNRVLPPDLLYLHWGNTQHFNHFVVSLGTEVTLSERLETGCQWRERYWHELTQHWQMVIPGSGDIKDHMRRPGETSTSDVG